MILVGHCRGSNRPAASHWSESTEEAEKTAKCPVCHQTVDRNERGVLVPHKKP